jgi:hypothetical protein
MLSLSIILDVDKRGFPATRGVDESKVIHHTEGFEVGTLRDGTAGGNDSVALAFKLDDGRVLIAETTAELYVSSARTIEGWQSGRRERGER